MDFEGDKSMRMVLNDWGFEAFFEASKDNFPWLCGTISCGIGRQTLFIAF